MVNSTVVLAIEKYELKKKRGDELKAYVAQLVSETFWMTIPDEYRFKKVISSVTEDSFNLVF